LNPDSLHPPIDPRIPYTPHSRTPASKKVNIHVAKIQHLRPTAVEFSRLGIRARSQPR
jgi:hypothetical protein